MFSFSNLLDFIEKNNIGTKRILNKTKNFKNHTNIKMRFYFNIPRYNKYIYSKNGHTIELQLN